MSAKFLKPFAIGILLLSGCDDSAGDGTRTGAGPGGRDQVLALSPSEELNVGRQSYREVLGEYRDQALPSSDQRALRVRRIVDRLAKAASIEPLQREIHMRVQGYTFEWEATVVREKQVNAFCLPAGKMVVFTGILPIAESDDQLATVLSHEMAHALAHHGSERVAREHSGGGMLSKMKYDRFQESEADHIGIFLMAFAGYDPDAAGEFWRHMRDISGGREPPEFMSDHPSHETRIKQLRAWAPQAKAAKKAFDEGRIAK